MEQRQELMLNGVPLRLNICNRQGECVTVKTKRPLLVVGSVVEIITDDVFDFTNAVHDADDDLNSTEVPWEDNFDLSKQRRKNNHKEE